MVISVLHLWSRTKGVARNLLMEGIKRKKSLSGSMAEVRYGGEAHRSPRNTLIIRLNNAIQIVTKSTLFGLQLFSEKISIHDGGHARCTTVPLATPLSHTPPPQLLEGAVEPKASLYPKRNNLQR